MSTLFQFRVMNPQGAGLKGAEFTLYIIRNADEEDEHYAIYQAAAADDYCDLWSIRLSGNLESSPAHEISKVIDGKHFSTHGGASTLGRKVHFRWGSSVEVVSGDNFKLHTTERNFSRGSTFELVYNTFSK